MTALRVVDGDRLRCMNDAAHPVTVTRSGDRLLGWCSTCFDYSAPTPDVLASLAWYDSHENLAVLLDWLGDLTAGASYRHVVEKPWNYEPEWRCAVAAREHESATETTEPSKLGGRPLTFSHSINKDGMNDDRADCNDCGWTFDNGQVLWLCPFCECLLETADDVERKAHLGCLADVAHDEQVAQEAAS